MLEEVKDNLLLIATILGSLSVITASLAAFHRKVVKPGLELLQETKDMAGALLELAKAQLEPNDGGSLIDKVDAQVEASSSFTRALAEHTVSDKDNFRQQILLSQEQMERTEEVRRMLEQHMKETP